jgi:hypothetical protein
LIRLASMPAFYSPGQHAFHDDPFGVEGQELFHPTPAAPFIIEFTKVFYPKVLILKRYSTNQDSH